MLDVTLWAFDVLDALDVRGALVAGHSMGGMIAAEMAALCPQQVERLALIAPAGLWLDAHPIPDLFATLPFELPQLLFHDVALGVKLLTGGLPLDAMKEAVQQGGSLQLSALLARFEDTGFLQKFLIDNARRLGMAGKLLFPIPERGLAERLYRVRAKTVLIWGDADRMIAPVYADAFLRHLPEARLVRVPAAGHMVPYEKSDAVVAAIAQLAS
jgi:pimeloyl-ACP methyl ester carboxylesterase